MTHLKITNTSPHGRHTRVEVNGVEIHKFATRVTLFLDAAKPNIAWVEIPVGLVDVDCLVDGCLPEEVEWALLDLGWTPPKAPSTTPPPCPGPTQDAYDAACAALEKHRQRADAAEVERDYLAGRLFDLLGPNEVTL